MDAEVIFHMLQGKYRLVIETTGTASVSLGEDDILGGYSLASPSKNSKYNRSHRNLY